MITFGEARYYINKKAQLDLVSFEGYHYKVTGIIIEVEVRTGNYFVVYLQKDDGGGVSAIVSDYITKIKAMYYSPDDICRVVVDISE